MEETKPQIPFCTLKFLIAHSLTGFIRVRAKVQLSRPRLKLKLLVRSCCQVLKGPSAPLAIVPSAGCGLLGYAEEKLPKPPRSWSRKASQQKSDAGQTPCENVLKCRNKQKTREDIQDKIRQSK